MGSPVMMPMHVLGRSLKVSDCPRQRIFERDLRLPFQQRLRPADIWPAHLRIVQWERMKADVTG